MHDRQSRHLIERLFASWDEAQLRRLIAFAVVLQDRKGGAHADLARKLDDQNPARWVSLDELDRKLGFTAEELAE